MTVASPRPIASRPAVPSRQPARPSAPRARANARSQHARGAKPEPKILFQKFFKSVGPRTYAAQLKQAGNGNHFLVLTEGKRDEKSGELKKCSLFVFSEDFANFFQLAREAEQFVQAHPVSAEVRKKREQFWSKQKSKPMAQSSKTNPPRS